MHWPGEPHDRCLADHTPLLRQAPMHPTMASISILIHHSMFYIHVGDIAMTMTLTCNGDCNHQQQSQCNAHTAMTIAMTCNGDDTLKHNNGLQKCLPYHDTLRHNNGLQKCACSNACVCSNPIHVRWSKVTTVCNNVPAPIHVCARDIRCIGHSNTTNIVHVTSAHHFAL